MTVPPGSSRLSCLSCASCSRGERHCHGSAIVHPSGPAECTEDGCALPPEAHVTVVACSQTGCPCHTDKAEEAA